MCKEEKRGKGEEKEEKKEEEEELGGGGEGGEEGRKVRGGGKGGGKIGGGEDVVGGPQESLQHRSSPLEYCFPFTLMLRRMGDVLLGRSNKPITCFPVHNLMGWGERQQTQTQTYYISS